MEEYKIKVYVQVDSTNVITNILSNVESVIIGISIDGWSQIDEGQGDKYSHAQGCYLDKPLADMQGKYNYKLDEGKVVELTDEEKEKLFPTQQAQPIEEETLSKEVANLKISDMKKDTIITNALQTIANLKVEIMGLKGGNA